MHTSLLALSSVIYSNCYGILPLLKALQASYSRKNVLATVKRRWYVSKNTQQHVRRGGSGTISILQQQSESPSPLPERITCCWLVQTANAEDHVCCQGMANFQRRCRRVAALSDRLLRSCLVMYWSMSQHNKCFSVLSYRVWRRANKVMAFPVIYPVMCDMPLHHNKISILYIIYRSYLVFSGGISASRPLRSTNTLLAAPAGSVLCCLAVLYEGGTMSSSEQATAAPKKGEPD